MSIVNVGACLWFPLSLHTVQYYDDEFVVNLRLLNLGSSRHLLKNISQIIRGPHKLKCHVSKIDDSSSGQARRKRKS
jgi:hypothetical protein